MPTTSGITSYASSRDQIIKRALQLVGAIGEGETPTSTQLSETAIILNDLVKEWNADGMPLWKIKEISWTPVNAQSTYTIGKNAAFNINSEAPLRVIKVWWRDATSNNDTPIELITRDRYELLSDKTSTGYVNQIWYDPPGNLNTNAVQNGIFHVYLTPDTNFATNATLYAAIVTSFEDFNAGTDLPDFPSYWYNALTWGLADQLAYPNRLPFAERSMISKKAGEHKLVALSAGTEEGSLFIQPDWIRMGIPSGGRGYY